MVEDLVRRAGRYWSRGGLNGRAMLALGLGIAPNVPGFLTTTHVVPAHLLPPSLVGLYHSAWFVGFFVAGGVYWLLSRARPRAGAGVV